MVYILTLVFSVTGFILIFRYIQVEKKKIILRMNDRYPNANEYVVAIKYELEKQGKNVVYSGNGHFIIDGMNYRIRDRKRISADGKPMQLTTLQYLK